MTRTRKMHIGKYITAMLLAAVLLSGCSSATEEAGQAGTSASEEAIPDVPPLPQKNTKDGLAKEAEVENARREHDEFVYPPPKEDGKSKNEAEGQEEDRGPEYLIVIDGKVYAEGLYFKESDSYRKYQIRNIVLEDEDRTACIDVQYMSGDVVEIDVWENDEKRGSPEYFCGCSVMTRDSYEKLYKEPEEQ